MTADKMRAEFEASHLYADYHTPEEIEFDFVEFSRGWQAGVLAERERAAAAIAEVMADPTAQSPV